MNNNLFDRATHQERRSYLIKPDSYRDENILSSCSGKCEKCNNPINVLTDTKHAGMSSTEWLLTKLQLRVPEEFFQQLEDRVSYFWHVLFWHCWLLAAPFNPPEVSFHKCTRRIPKFPLTGQNKSKVSQIMSNTGQVFFWFQSL